MMQDSEYDVKRMATGVGVVVSLHVRGVTVKECVQ
jgi:hypothetical protein